MNYLGMFVLGIVTSLSPCSVALLLPMLWPYVKLIAVFGSFTRGEEAPESNIDILVELKTQRNIPDWARDGSV